jgi:hypothetical protein
MDQTDNDGVEITNGITARSRAAVAVGTSPAVYAKAKLKIGDVSGTDDLAFGFRKAEAYQANVDDYDEMACLNVISGNVVEETILNNAATSSTDTTLDWADGGEHTLEVYVSAAGVVTFKVDGTAIPTSMPTPSMRARWSCLPLLLNATTWWTPLSVILGGRAATGGRT